jgi:hypothetical protein
MGVMEMILSMQQSNYLTNKRTIGCADARKRIGQAIKPHESQRDNTLPKGCYPEVPPQVKTKNRSI